jgi:C-terminal processing protease CtpA/Prc
MDTSASDPLLTPRVMHKSAVPPDGAPKHRFMFKDSPSHVSPDTYSDKVMQSVDDLVSVTVRKDSPTQRAGISLVERQGEISISQIDENGLFHGTQVEEGDQVLSVNGKKLKKGEGAKHVMKAITKAKATLTIVVKKPGINNPTSGYRVGKIKKKPNKLVRKELHQKKDLSLNPNHDPPLMMKESSGDSVDLIRIKSATKLYREQPLGLSMVEYNNMIFISDISLESPFCDSKLQVGDRVVSVGSMNFMKCADAALAIKTAEKATKEVELVVEKGRTDVPEEIKKKLKDIALLQSPRQEVNKQRELAIADLITPNQRRKEFNSSFSGPFRTPSQREKELDREVLLTPNLQFSNSINISSPSATITTRQHDNDDVDDDSDVCGDGQYNNSSVDPVEKALSRKANGVIGESAVIKPGHNSWSHSGEMDSTPYRKNRKGKRLSPHRKSNTVTRSSHITTKIPQKKSSKLSLDDTSDESSLDDEVEESLSKLKNKTSLHSSCSHTDNAKTPTSAVKPKKGKRRSANGIMKTGKSSVMKALKHKPKSKSKPTILQTPDDESSINDGVEVAADEMLSPQRQAQYVYNASFSKSHSQMVTDDYDGDIIRIKVKKNSESEPGVKVRMISGMFILTSLPPHEKRINVGAQVLAINGTMNIDTVVKAESLMSQTERYVTLMVDFSSPIDNRRNCSCCGVNILPNGEHLRPKDCPPNDDSGLFTPKVSNYSDHRPVRNLLPSTYNVDDYNSETEDEKDDEEQQCERANTSKFQSGDKFMIRVKTKGNPGIKLFEFSGQLYVESIEQGGAFYSTPIDTGDRVISMNGKKTEEIKSVSNATAMLKEKETVCIYVCRSDKSSAGYKEALQRCR